MFGYRRLSMYVKRPWPRRADERSVREDTPIDRRRWTLASSLWAMALLGLILGCGGVAPGQRPPKALVSRSLDRLPDGDPARARRPSAQARLALTIELSHMIAPLEQQAQALEQRLPRGVRWVTLALEVDGAVWAAPRPEAELGLRFLGRLFAGQGILLGRGQGERLLGQLPFAPTGPALTRLLDEAHARGRVLYHGELQAALSRYVALLRRDADLLRDALATLRHAHYAEDALASFYIAHANALIGLGRAVVDLPLAPVNLVRRVRGQEEIEGLGGYLRPIPYVGEYGQRYGPSMETGATLGLLLTPAGGSVVSRALGGALGRSAGWIAAQGGRLGPIAVRVMRGWLVSGGLAYGVQSAWNLVDAAIALKTGKIRGTDGQWRALTEEHAWRLIEEILVNLTVVSNLRHALRRGQEGEVERQREREREQNQQRQEEAAPVGLSPTLAAIRGALEDVRAKAQFDAMLAAMGGDGKRMLRALEGIQQGLGPGETIEQKLIDRWQARQKPAATAPRLPAELLAEIERELGREAEIGQRIARFEADHPQVSGVGEWRKTLNGAIKRLDDLRRKGGADKRDAVVGQTQGERNNLNGLAAAIEVAERSEGVVAVERNLPTSDGGSISIDVIADGGRAWIEVKAVNSFGLGSSTWIEMEKQAKRMVGLATHYRVGGQPVSVVWEFSRGVSAAVAGELQAMGIRVRGMRQ
jgi:Family of unknown function (DUF5614)